MSSILSLLNAAWKHKDLSALALLVAALFMLLHARGRIRELEAQLAARPEVREIQLTKVVQGPERVRVETRWLPSGEVASVRSEERDGTTTETGSRKESVPVGFCPSRGRAFVGVGLHPLHPMRGGLVRVGFAVSDSIDLDYTHLFSEPFGEAHRIGLTYRW